MKRKGEKSMEKIRKYIKIILVAFLFFVSPVGVKANEQSETFQLVNEMEKENEKGSFKELTYKIGHEKFLADVYEDEIIIYDSYGNVAVSATYSSLETKEYVFGKKTVNRSTVSIYNLIDIYDSPENWRGWNKTDIRRIVPQFTGTTIPSGALAALIAAALATEPITISLIAINFLAGAISDTIVNNKAFYVAGEYNYNYNCDIFRLERVNQYDSLENKIYTGMSYANWFSSPWDYSCPAACRTLAEKYY